MNERDQHQEELAELQLHLRTARGEHRSMLAVTAALSTAVFVSLPLAIFTDDPAWLNITMATVGSLGGTFAILETEIAKAELKEAQRKVEDYETRNYISRLRS